MGRGVRKGKGGKCVIEACHSSLFDNSLNLGR